MITVSHNASFVNKQTLKVMYYHKYGNHGRIDEASV